MRSASILWSTLSCLSLGALAVALACGRDVPTGGRDGAAAFGPARRDDRGPSPALRRLHDDIEAQDRTPVDQLRLVLDGFSTLKRDVARPPEVQQQARTLRYCAELNPDFMQCVIFDGPDADAHLTGVEYVISAALHATLPVEERQYWHAHLGEADSGMMVAPGIPHDAHDELMTHLRGTYGKTWRTWDTRRDILPFGDPTLMWAIPPGKIGPVTRAVMQARRGQQ
jgi:hypothetical protein